MSVRLSSEQQTALQVMEDLLSYCSLKEWQHQIDDVLAKFVYMMTQNEEEDEIGFYKEHLSTLVLLRSIFAGYPEKKQPESEKQ